MNRGPRGMKRKQGSVESKASFSSIKKLSPYLKKYRVELLITIFFAVLSAASFIFTPYLLGEITNTVSSAFNDKGNKISDINLSLVNKYGLLAFAAYATNMICAFLSSFFIASASQNISRDLRTNISEKINKVPLSYFDSTTFGNVLSRVTNDVDTISLTLNDSMVGTVTSVTQVVGVLVMMFIVSPVMALIPIASSLVNMFAAIFIIKASQKFFKRQQNLLGALNGQVEEDYSGQVIVKVFNQEDSNLDRFDKTNKELAKTIWKAQFFGSIIMPVMRFIGNLSYIVVCLVGGRLVVSGNLAGIGDIQKFVMYTKQFNRPVETIANVLTNLQSTAASTERVMEFLELEELSVENDKMEIDKNTVKGEVQFKNVNFGYNKNKQIIFDFSTKVKAGSKVAIVGPTGAGKTTMVNLLMRFYETNSGNITIDGVSTKDLKRENVSSLFGMVLQDTWLFEGTIKENLKYGNQNATDEEIKKACDAAYVDHFIMSLPKGYDYQLDENANISAGQKQLLTIARAMISNAPMLILDEATSSVDTRTEELIQKAMDKLMHGRTSFVIAHRLSTIKNSDNILVMKDGNIIEQGNHNELMAKNGFYTDLYNSQFSDK